MREHRGRTARARYDSGIEGGQIGRERARRMSALATHQPRYISPYDMSITHLLSIPWDIALPLTGWTVDRGVSSPLTLTMTVGLVDWSLCYCSQPKNEEMNGVSHCSTPRAHSSVPFIFDVMGLAGV